MNEEDLKNRTKTFALRTLKLINALPNTPAGRAVAGQLARAATSVAANYRAAYRGHSKAEFIAKLGVVVEEADESEFWLEIIIESEMLKPALVEPLKKEASEIVAIMVSSRKSAANLQK